MYTAPTNAAKAYFTSSAETAMHERRCRGHYMKRYGSRSLCLGGELDFRTAARQTKPARIFSAAETVAMKAQSGREGIWAVFGYSSTCLDARNRLERLRTEMRFDHPKILFQWRFLLWQKKFSWVASDPRAFSRGHRTLGSPKRLLPLPRQETPQ